MMEDRKYNFGAGPSVLSDEVLIKIKEELFNYKNTGMSIMEMSHRSNIYMELLNETKDLLIKLMDIPDNYEILFMHGGATGQFSAIPLNLLDKKADYIITGNFSKKAAEEASKYGEVNIIYDDKINNYSRIPKLDELNISDDSDYLYLCSNNTIYGTQWHNYPISNIPLIADMSSDILSKRINVSDFALIFAGAQKNLGIAGVCVVIIRKDLIKESKHKMPIIFEYPLCAKNNSLYNTPATYPIYVLNKVLHWLDGLGGVDVIEKLNIEKARLLYEYLDNQSFYISHAQKDSRSMMNITFKTNTEELDNKFVKEAENNDLIGLKGHRLTGGLRASIYNAMDINGVKSLIEFMDKFARENM